MIISTGRTAGGLRKASVTPVFMKGKKDDPRNYRPFSLTSIPGKLVEQIILETFSRHMKDKKVIRNSQHAFAKGKSRLTNLINFYNESYEQTQTVP